MGPWASHEKAWRSCTHHTTRNSLLMLMSWCHVQLASLFVRGCLMMHVPKSWAPEDPTIPPNNLIVISKFITLLVAGNTIIQLLHAYGPWIASKISNAQQQYFVKSHTPHNSRHKRWRDLTPLVKPYAMRQCIPLFDSMKLHFAEPWIWEKILL